MLNRIVQPQYNYAQYLSEVKCWSYRGLLSRCRDGCHGLRGDTGWWEDSVHLDRKVLMCRSIQDVEDEHHFLFDSMVALCSRLFD